jgi:hypothetical protein
MKKRPFALKDPLSCGRCRPPPPNGENGRLPSRVWRRPTTRRNSAHLPNYGLIATSPGEGRLSMRFVQHLKWSSGRVAPKRHSATDTSWKSERSGTFSGYTVSGWRYIDIAIWHITVWSSTDDEPGRTYVVSAGEFFPELVASPEKFAILRLIALWEADGFR